MALHSRVPSPSALDPATILGAYREPAVLLDPQYRVVATNRAYQERYGCPDDPVGRHCYEVSHHYTVPCDQAGETCPLKACVSTGEEQRVLHLHHTPRGQEHVEVEAHPVRDAEGRIAYVVEVMRPSRLASSRPSREGLVGRSVPFNRMVELVQRVAPSEAAVLLEGETGTGKELAALAIHRASARADGPFVPVECSGLTETLFESELFGYEKGAFTGAHSRREGLVEAARGGTLFLDEVGDIPLSLQVKLLRLLETATYRRVGGVEPRKADFRLVCATHHRLEEMVREGRFRADLYYRISVFPIRLPPLRERREDIPLLVETLLQRLAPERPRHVHPQAMDCLLRYDYPGNVRELRNILQQASLMADGDTILPQHLPQACRHPGAVQSLPATPLSLEEVERRHLRHCLASHQGSRRELAQRLGISERTLYRKLRRYGIG